VSVGTSLTEDTEGKAAVKRFKEYIREEYAKIATLPVDEPVKAAAQG
jgi:hypothetical protein